MEFDHSDRVFKMFDKIEEIYKLTYEIFESKRYKIINSKENILPIELSYIIDINDQKINSNIKLDMKPNSNGDFSSDYNYILRSEIIDLKKKYNKDVSELKLLIIELKNEKSDLIAEKSDLKTKISKLNTEISEIKKDLYNLNKDNSEFKKEISKLKKEKCNLNTEISELNEDISELKSQISVLKKIQNKKLSVDLNNVKQQNNKELRYNKNFITLAKTKFEKDLDIKYKKLEIKDLQKLPPNLDKLNYSNCNLNDISNLSKFNFKELKELNFSNNLINSINVLKDVKFPKLTLLDLNHNKIGDLEPLAQIDLTNIERIDLSFNCINDINVFYRVKVPHLKYLDLSHNNIREIKICSKFNCLEELYLDNNQINQEIYSDLLNFLREQLSKFIC